ncbi:AMP-binding protein [bacterium]|nr:AMP-binding protein [bacterium]
MATLSSGATVGNTTTQSASNERTSEPVTPYPPRTLDYPEVAAFGLLRQAALDFPQRAACVFYGQSLSYLQLWEEACRVANLLKAYGVEPGDRVGLLLPNVPEYISVLNGIWLAGGVAVAISPLMVAGEVSPLLKATDCRVVIALDLLASRLRGGNFQPRHTFLVTLCDRLPLLPGLGCVWMRRRETGAWTLPNETCQHSFHREVERHAPTWEPVANSSQDTPAYILATGGTTGTPKAVTLSHRNLVVNAWQQMHWGRAERGNEVFLAVLPFFHCYGLSACLMTGLATTATLIVHPRFELESLLKLMSDYQPTYFHAVPAMLVKLNERLRKRPQRMDSLRYCISGGAPLSLDVATEFTEHSGAIVVEGYGLSEASPVTHVGPLDGKARRNSIGLPLPDTETRIVDPEDGDRDLPNGEVGELVVRGPQVMLGYWNNPEETTHVIRDGWLFTGDLAVRDGDGFFRIVDRKKDLIITSGFNVYPEEVETALREHPFVRDAAVVGVPDSQRGERVKAWIIPETDKPLDEVLLKAFCQNRLAAHKRPREFALYQGEFPRNFLGKLLRRQLRDTR